jgi:hypothetical protein
MLVHRVPRYAVTTARAQQVSGRNGLRSPAGIKRHAYAIRIISDRRHFGAKFHCKAKIVQMLAQNRLGAPLRLAALKIIARTSIGKILAPDFLQTGAEELKAPDVHAGAKKRLSQAGSIEHLHHRWLEKGATRLAMRRQPSLDDARLDAMA